jgi:hypothetical protein
MASIICDNAAVEPLLRKLVDQIIELGGRISADAEIICQNGNLSIEYRVEGDAKTELIFLPEAALIPVSPVSFSLQGDEIIVQAIDGEMNAERRSLLDLMVRIYNLTGKIRNFRSASPRLSLALSPDVLQHLLAGRPAPKKQPEPDAPEYDAHVVGLFMKSRTLGYKFSGTSKKTPVLMPIIDAFNHHLMGAAFRSVRDGDAEGLALGISRPMAGSSECFAMYGFYDALDTYRQYAYVDQNAPFLRSAPCELEIADIGRITVQSLAGAKYDGPLAKELQSLRIFMPRVALLAPGHVRISHLIIPGPKRKFALRRVLAEIIKALDPSRTDNSLTRSVAEAERYVLTRNMAFYRDLDRMLDSRPPDSTTSALRQLAVIQRARIQTYIDAINQPTSG